MTVLDLAQELIRLPSLTPEDGGCLDLLAGLLAAGGFQTEFLDAEGVRNLWATRGEGPTLCLCGHVDVVPPGPREFWNTDPFTPTLQDGFVYGRGAADMKGSVAALVCAALSAEPNGRTAILVTSDEEGPGTFGVGWALDQLLSRGEEIDAALVGEPTSEARCGDAVKVGRRGSFSGHLVVRGKQGHVAYPHLATNAVQECLGALDNLARTEWDRGGSGFDPTTFQISNIHAGTGAFNVIPGVCEVDFNLRFGVASTAENIEARIRNALAGLDYELTTEVSAEPFATPEGSFRDALVAAVGSVTGESPRLSTSGGTSDARHFARCGIPVAEFGPVNATIHAANECVGVDELATCQAVFETLIRTWRG